MKRFAQVFALCVLVLFASCGQKATETSAEKLQAANITLAENQKPFGAAISPKGAITMAQVSSKVTGNEEVKMKVKGEVESVCEVKGCWMRIKQTQADKEGMLVRFKDYGFFVPMDIEGKTAIMEGVAKMDTTSVADLRHYAEDEGLSKEEIAKITEPEVSVVFMADGVIIED